MRNYIICLLLLTGCQTGKIGLAYLDNGVSMEASAFKYDETPIGIRASVGRINLPNEWEADSTMRYAVGPYVQIPLIEGFYLEPRFECAFYPELDTSFEPETGLRLGWKWMDFEIFGGARFPLGNGHRHENLNPPEYEHVPAGIHPEFGIVWSFDF